MCFSYLFVTRYTHDLQDKIFTHPTITNPKVVQATQQAFKLHSNVFGSTESENEPRGIFQLQVVARP